LLKFGFASFFLFGVFALPSLSPPRYIAHYRINGARFWHCFHPSGAFPFINGPAWVVFLVLEIG
jgi:hypothetical protein